MAIVKLPRKKQFLLYIHRETTLVNWSEMNSSFQSVAMKEFKDAKYIKLRPGDVKTQRRTLVY